MKNNKHRRNAEKKKKPKNFNLKTRHWLVEFSQKHNIHNSCHLPNFCYTFLVNPQVLNDVRRSFFRRKIIKPLDLRKLGNFREVPKKFRLERKCPACRILEITLEYCKKTPLKHFTKTRNIVYLENVSTFTGKNICFGVSL